MRVPVPFVTLHGVDLRAEESSLAALACELSGDERVRADRFSLPEGRRRFVVGRAMLRRLLAERLGICAAAIRFTEGAHGKPHLVADANRTKPPLEFNLSHTDDLALIVIGPSEVGVDVESFDRQVETMAVVRRFFSETERSGFEAVPGGIARDQLFFRVWTRKEALVKAVGRGLNCPLSSFSVPLGPIPAGGLLIDCPEGTGRKWRLFDVESAQGVPPGHAAAVVTGAEIQSITAGTSHIESHR
jgi:4'-phosphopantetheinyl transferase